MDGNEILQFFATHADSTIASFCSIVGAIAGGILTRIFLRGDTSTKEFEKMKAGQFKEVTEDLLNSGAMTYMDLYKAKNFLRIAKKADDIYSQEKHEESEPFNLDWFMRFYDAVGLISDENMQEIWAKILAGEIAHPSSYSLRTLDVLRNLSQSEAALFQKVCVHCFIINNTVFFPNYVDFLDKAGVSYGDILKVDELGLINSSNDISYCFNPNARKTVFLFNDNLCLSAVSKENSHKGSIIRMYPLTSVGEELATLVSEMPPDEEFFMLAENIQKNNKNITVEVHEVVSVEGNTCRWNPVNLLECED